MDATPDRYIHTFSPGEQARLVRQGEFLAPWVQPGVDFTGCRRVLELGCGVGAQMRLLLPCFPHAHFTGVDISPRQLARAGTILAEPLAAGRATLLEASVFELPFGPDRFDGAYTFWVLEHLADHAGLLQEAFRVLRPGGLLYCTEVFNAGLYVAPTMPGLARWWQAFNALQRELGGDPDVGVRLAGLLHRAGFTVETFRETSPQLDGRMADPARRRDFLDFWQSLLLSGTEPLLAHGRVTEADIAALKADFAALADDPDAVFRYAAFQVRARKPH